MKTQYDPKEPFVPRVGKVGKFKVLFNDKGDLLTHAHRWAAKGAIEEDNHVFLDKLIYHGFTYKNHVVFVSEKTNRFLFMFKADFDEAIKADRFNNKVIEGYFYCTRKGIAQGVRPWYGDVP